MARIFKTPFGAQGDTEQVPEAPQGDGSVSLTQGFGYDYEREYEDPAAKDIRREVMNGLFHDITEAVGDIQLSGIAKWDAAAAPYPAGAVVWHSSVAWRSTSGNNNDEPGSGGWRPINAEATETEAGISAIATQAEVDAGDDDAKFVTALKLKNWVKQATETVLGMLKVATQAQVDEGEDDTTAVTPLKLHGIALGLGQTWQSVDRNFDVNYTNTTGRPIMVSVSLDTGSVSSSLYRINCSVDGVNVGRDGEVRESSSQAATYSNVSFIVPSGSVYFITQSSSAATNEMLYVSELR